jgi:arylsulfatase A-like enzyme
MPLHLEEHLDTAHIEGSEVPEDLPEPVVWSFDEPQPDWKPVKLKPPHLEAVEPVQAEDALRLPLTMRNSIGGPRLTGAIYVKLPNLSLQEWAYVEIRARTRDPMLYVGLQFNYTEVDRELFPFYSPGDRDLFVTDGTVQTYRLSLDSSNMRKWEGPWTHLAISFNSRDVEEPVTFDILSIRVIPREAEPAADDAGERTEGGGAKNDSAPDAAQIEDPVVPKDLPKAIEWRFDEPQPDWKPVKPIPAELEAVKPVRADDALRVTLTTKNRRIGDPLWLLGTICVELPDWNLQDWAYVEIRARTGDPMRNIALGFNYTETEEDRVWDLLPFYSLGDNAPLVTDGTIQTYRLSLDSPSMRKWEGAWTHLGIGFGSRRDEEAATLDILSVSVMPKEAIYAAAPTGVKTEIRNRVYRRTLYTHAPGQLEYSVRVPEAGRLDLGIGVLRTDAPVTFRVTASPAVGEAESLLEETYADQGNWGQHSVDMSHLAGQTVTLALEAEAERAGTVALWAAPTLTGTRSTKKPNVIFYVIDGAGADYMSVYGYNRRTTPNIDRLAAEGALFERAYSNSSWTRPSTASFMTSLQHSVLGGFKNGFNVVPEEAPTMAQHMHGARYQTAVFTANPNAGRMSGLERGVDFFREDWAEFSYGGDLSHEESSRYLHEAFWRWREEYPAEPYWVHFQTVDIHSDFPAVAPFSGLFVGPEQLKMWEEWQEQLKKEEGRSGIYSKAWEKTGLSRVAFYAVMQGLYDETMAHNDYQIGRLVERLKAEGEWENTLLIIGADHSIDAAMNDMGIAILETLPPRWSQPMFRPSITRVPLIFVWPGHIAAGQRFSEPVVSMIDVLPTLLDLVGLPMPEVMQGQSLAPFLLGKEGWEQRPVILDEFEVDRDTGELRGTIEVIDGRWGASLEINPKPPEEDEDEEAAQWRRPVPLLLYDLWNDPYCLNSLHEEHPDLVEKYTKFLEAQFEAHKALAQQFTRSKDSPLTPEQLRTLRSLGYIQ